MVVEIGLDGGGSTELGRGVTDGDGRIAQFTPPLAALTTGVYRVRFFRPPTSLRSMSRGFIPKSM